MKLNKDVVKKLSCIKNSFYDDFKIEFLYHSNHLEGSTFSKDNLEKLLMEKKVEGVHFIDDVLETRNSLNVFDMVINDSGKELDKFMLFAWHRELKKGTVDDEIHNIGCFKKYENRLRNIDLKLASPLEVDNLIYNLLMDYKEINNLTIEDIAKFHSRFELIHPFQDGNGRIGRFIILKQCIDNDIDLISIDEKYIEDYKKALYKSQKENDVSDLVNIFKSCQSYLDHKLGFYKTTIDLVKKEILEN